MKDYEALLIVSEAAFGRAFAQDLKKHFAAYHNIHVLLNTVKNSLAQKNREFLDMKFQRDEFYKRLHPQERLL